MHEETVGQDLLSSMNEYLTLVDDSIKQISLYTAIPEINKEPKEARETAVLHILQLRLDKETEATRNQKSYIIRLEHELSQIRDDLEKSLLQLEKIKTENEFIKEERNSAIEQLRLVYLCKNDVVQPFEMPLNKTRLSKLAGHSLDLEKQIIQMRNHEQQSQNNAMIQKLNNEKSNIEDMVVDIKFKYAEKCEQLMKLEDDYAYTRQMVLKLNEKLRDSENKVAYYESIHSNKNDVKMTKLNLNSVIAFDTRTRPNTERKETLSYNSAKCVESINSMTDEVIGVAESVDLARLETRTTKFSTQAQSASCTYVSSAGNSSKLSNIDKPKSILNEKDKNHKPLEQSKAKSLLSMIKKII